MITGNGNIKSFDERRNIAVPGDFEKTIHFCVDHFFKCAKKAIDRQGIFTVALSGGNTPKPVYKGIANSKKAQEIDWSRVLLFWSDERNVPSDHPESNYKMVMESGFSQLPIPPENVFRMKAEKDIEKHALEYEKIIFDRVPGASFDLILLGMGDDGHTASLFPMTHGLHAENRLVVANFIPQKETWRMTMTFECINAAKLACFYAFGKNKAEIVSEVLNGPYNPNLLPSQKVGTPLHKALWILDISASFLVSTQ